MVNDALNGRESVPNSLLPPPGYVPVLTRRQRLHALVAEARRRVEHISVNGRPLSPRSLRMLGRECPGGWNSANGYNRHACRCESCREAMSRARVAHYRRQRNHLRTASSARLLSRQPMEGPAQSDVA